VDDEWHLSSPLLILINGKLSDVIYRPRDCNMNLKLFPVCHGTLCL